jgi:hypothetical protein
MSLPYEFRFVTKLGLGIRPARKSSIRDLINELADYFSPSGPGNLRELQLFLPYNWPFFTNMINAADLRATVRESLECHLGPLRKIRASHSVSVNLESDLLVGSYPHMHIPRECHLSAEKLNDVIFTATTEYFNMMKKEISGDFD